MSWIKYLITRARVRPITAMMLVMALVSIVYCMAWKQWWGAVGHFMWLLTTLSLITYDEDC